MALTSGAIVSVIARSYARTVTRTNKCRLARNSLRELAMQYLFNSRGQHIANFVNGQLHAPTGQNIGHYLESQSIFIDMQGRYLGEIISENRLMYRRNSPHRSVNYGSYGNYGNVGNYGNPGNYGSIGTPGGFEDVPGEKLGT
jgi:hypothetical protein